MDMFPDLDGKIRLRQLQSDERAEENRERAESILARLQVRWCFVLNPRRRSPYPKLLWCDTR